MTGLAAQAPPFKAGVSRQTGQMQFAGTGTATGSWPYRNSYTTGNKSGQITFAINGVTYTPVAAGPWMRIATADGSGVDGVSVTRW